MSVKNNISKISNNGIVADKITFKGENVAAGDQYFSTITQHNHTAFTITDFSVFEHHKYDEPIFVKQLITKAKTDGLVIVGGNYEFDKHTFIKYLAYKIQKLCKKDIVVKKWTNRTSKNIFLALEEAKDAQVIILNQIVPQDIRFDILRLEEWTRQHKKVILISTDSPVSHWKLPPDIYNQHWFDIPHEVYDISTLVNYIIREFEQHKKVYPFKNRLKNLDASTVLFGHCTIQTIAEKFNTISRIRILFRKFQNVKKIRDEELLSEILEKTAKQQTHLIAQWFNTLSSKQKEVALMLALFEGVYEDQFFNVVEELVQDVWEAKGKSSELLQIDYADVEELNWFYHFEASRNGQEIIKGKSANQRIDLLKTIWKSNRQKLKSTLPFLEQLIYRTEDKNCSNDELFNTKSKKQKIQNAISQSFSAISVLHLSSIEHILLRLASNKNPKIQEITAKALAKWLYYSAGEELLFNLLSKWQNDNFFQKIINKNQLSSDINDSEMEEIAPSTFIDATIALTLAHAADHYEPNHLSEDFVQIFDEFTNTIDPFVRKRLKKYTIPKCTKNHLTQLEQSLLKMLKYPDLIYPIADGMAKAYKEVPDEVDVAISFWLKKVASPEMQQKRNNDFRNNILICIIRTLSNIKYTDILRLHNAYDIIKKLQEEEYSSSILPSYLNFIEKQIQIHGATISEHISTIISNLPLRLRPNVIHILKKLYKKEKEKLVKGKRTIEIGGVKILLSSNPSNFTTNIEKIAYNWFDYGNKICREIGMEISYYITDTIELPAQQVIEERKEAIKAQTIWEENQIIVRTEKEPKMKGTSGGIFSWFVQLLTLSQYDEYFKPHILDLLPFLIKKRMLDEDVMRVIAHKMEKSQKKIPNNISDFIAHFPSHYRATEKGIGLVIIILIVILMSVFL